MNKITNVDVDNKKVIVRVDYNVPIKDNEIVDNNRIVESLKTIKYLIKHNSKIILMSHLGKIKTNEDKKNNSLKIVAEELSNLLKKDVEFSEKLKGKELEEKINKLNAGDILLIENTRYMDVPNKLESNCDKELSKYWASLADVFINDAFGSTHRKHASTYGISEFIESAIGFLVEKEITELSKIIDVKKDVILGGIKVADKLPLIENLIENTNHFIIGGGMCATFLKAEGYETGKTLVDENSIDYCKKIIEENEEKFILPVDVITENGIKDINEIKKDETIYDVGPKSIEQFKKCLNKKTPILINGTMGYIENEKYIEGTKSLYKYLSSKKFDVIACGGDTGKAVKKFKCKFTYVSTGGGAALKFLGGEELEALTNMKKKKYLLLNHKSYLGLDDAKKYLTDLKKINNKKLDLIIFPSLPYIGLFSESNHKIGAQNFYSYNYGSYTGEINLEALQSMNINYVMVGHSERKKYHLDSYDMIKSKLYKSINLNFKTVLCIGEMQKEKNVKKYLKKELDFYLKNIDETKLKNLLIAYEPGWAIGTGNALNDIEINDITEYIKSYFIKNYNKEMDVLYGGSVNKENIESIMCITDGVLIGKLSANIEETKEIIKLI